jgi:hypothetical protein
MMQGEAAETEERCGAKRQKFCSAQQPLDVHLTTKEETDQETREDGTRQFPFRTVEAAEKAFRKGGGTWVNNPNNVGEDHEVEIMHCAGPDCQMKQCSYPKCTVSLCVEHGSGRVKLFDHGYGYESEFDAEKCMECDKMACPGHSSKHGISVIVWSPEPNSQPLGVTPNPEHWFLKCDVCTNGTEDAKAGISVCGNGFPNAIMFPLCKDCVHVCTKIIDDDNYERHGEVCGFQCCYNCISEHTCGEDPTNNC